VLYFRKSLTHPLNGVVCSPFFPQRRKFFLVYDTEMSNFGYDDDVLLKWEITGTGRCEGSYSHFNSMMKRSIQAKQSDNDREPVYEANNLQVK